MHSSRSHFRPCISLLVTGCSGLCGYNGDILRGLFDSLGLARSTADKSHLFYFRGLRSAPLRTAFLRTPRCPLSVDGKRSVPLLIDNRAPYYSSVHVYVFCALFSLFSCSRGTWGVCSLPLPVCLCKLGRSPQSKATFARDS